MSHATTFLSPAKFQQNIDGESAAVFHRGLPETPDGVFRLVHRLENVCFVEARSGSVIGFVPPALREYKCGGEILNFGRKLANVIPLASRSDRSVLQCAVNLVPSWAATDGSRAAHQHIGAVRRQAMEQRIISSADRPAQIGLLGPAPRFRPS